MPVIDEFILETGRYEYRSEQVVVGQYCFTQPEYCWDSVKLQYLICGSKQLCFPVYGLLEWQEWVVTSSRIIKPTPYLQAVKRTKCMQCGTSGVEIKALIQLDFPPAYGLNYDPFIFSAAHESALRNTMALAANQVTAFKRQLIDYNAEGWRNLTEWTTSTIASAKRAIDELQMSCMYLGNPGDPLSAQKLEPSGSAPHPAKYGYEIIRASRGGTSNVRYGNGVQEFIPWSEIEPFPGATAFAKLNNYLKSLK